MTRRKGEITRADLQQMPAPFGVAEPIRSARRKAPGKPRASDADRVANYFLLPERYLAILTLLHECRAVILWI